MGKGGDFLSHTVPVDTSAVTSPSPRRVVSRRVHQSRPLEPVTPNTPFYHHVGYAADYIFYSYVNLNSIKQPIIGCEDTLQIRLVSWSEPIHPTRTPNVSAEQLALLKGCPLQHTKTHGRCRIFHCQTDDSCCDYTLFLFNLKHWN